MSKSELFPNRTVAGQKLADILIGYKNQPNGLVLALPRGGVPIAVEIAKTLVLPVDLCLVRKLGVPRFEELAFVAIALNDVIVLNERIMEKFQVSPDEVEMTIEREKRELLRRNELYRGEKPLPKISESTIFLVDDGIATGASMRAAISILKLQGASKIIIAVPVIPVTTYHILAEEVDEIVFLQSPETFYSLGCWYCDFTQVSDEEVLEMLFTQELPLI